MGRGKKLHSSKHSDRSLHHGSTGEHEKQAAWFKVSPLVKIILVAGILCAVGLKILSYLSPLHYLSTFNETQMKEVFSNEDNSTWAVVCKSITPTIIKDFQRVAKDKRLRRMAKFGVLDCSNGILRSGKTVKDQFNFEILQPPHPTIFLVGGNIKNPIVMPGRVAGSYGGMVTWLKDTLNPRPHSVASTTELTKRCIDHESCVLILKPGSGFPDSAKQAIRESLLLHRSLRFATLDSMKYDTTIHARLKVAEMQVNPEHSFAAIHFRQLSINNEDKMNSSEAARGEASISWEATAYKADDADIWVTGFKTWLDSVHATKWPEEENNETGGGTSKVIKLSIPPKVQKRKKKTASRRDKRTKEGRETRAEREAREERERVQELIRQKIELAQRMKMDEEAEAFVTDIEDEDGVVRPDSDDLERGQNEKNYILEEEDLDVNEEEEWNLDEDENVVEL